ncbi:MAG: hypothetical protein M1826_003952 [Phylliscum demangeonii]|nr:MAG: hypothetical protein M1826_003952 [Phylliscum demangeonii]
MPTVVPARVRSRPAHTPGPTYVSYTPDGRRMITVGSNNAIRVYTTGSVGEPVTIDHCAESHTAVVAANDAFWAGSEDGTVSTYSLQSHALENVLVRSSLPVRDLALSPDGEWLAVSSDELVVKVVRVHDMGRVLYLRQQRTPAKHVSFQPQGACLAVSCADGVIYVYSMSGESLELLRTVDGLARSLETDALASAHVAWHPDGRTFAVPTAAREVQVMSWRDWERQRTFSGGHTADITALAWSPNGALLATAGADGRVVVWETKTQRALVQYEYDQIMSLAWHPTENMVSFASADGEVFLYPDFLPPEHLDLLQQPLHASPFLHDPRADVPVTAGPAAVHGADADADPHARRHPRRRTPDSLDDVLGPDGDEDGGDDDFVIDDDGGGYADADLNGFGKRSHARADEADADADVRPGKRRATAAVWRPRVHEPFQAGSTPWRGNRRYLCLNLVGSVWTVDQETHHTVTVEFYDREYHRDFHFTDPDRYDQACLNDAGAAFACPPHHGHPALVFYRPHETWTSRADWRISLPHGERVLALSLSSSFVVMTTSTGFVRVYTLYGTPFRLYRQKSTPSVTCAAWRDYVLTVGNGAVAADGRPRLMYTIDNVKRDESCQSEDIVALPDGAEIQSVFFSDTGDPCLYDSTGVLLVLLHWRRPGQARWVPLLDTKLLGRLAGGRKEESYWPVGVARDQFHCIILKGGDHHPYFPRPLLTEFDFRIPLPTSTSAPEADGPADDEPGRLDESFVRHAVALELAEDLVAATRSTAAQRLDLARKQAEVDKTLLLLLARECREGEDRGMKALELVGLMTPRVMEAAGKVANRYGRALLEEKIRALADGRLAGDGEGNEED